MKILSALIVKEFEQMIRDPSSIIIAIAMGIKNDDNSPQTQTLVKSFDGSNYIRAKEYDNADKMYYDMARSKLKGIVVIPNNFTRELESSNTAHLQIITDGSEVNLANYAQSYPLAILQNWLYSSSKYRFKIQPRLFNPQIRYWFNQDINSHYFVLPGSLAITMTLIGMMLTALVIAREWERGTMEAILATKIKKVDFVLGKYIPYFILGLASMSFSVFMCVNVFKVPFRGSFVALLIAASIFLLTSMGTGLLISSFFKDQFLASQLALSIGLLPSMLLSGLIYPINSMPAFFQFLTKFIPARYFVMIIQSEFMAGTVNEILIPNCIFLAELGFLLFCMVYDSIKMKVD